MMPIFDLQVNGERVSLLGPAATVESKSRPGTWHVVYNGHCDCRGFEFRGRCRHLTTVEQLREAAAAVMPATERAKRIAAANADIWGD